MDAESRIKTGLQNGDATAYFYGSAFDDDYLLRNSASLPLYGPLARKAMSHYLGDRYNPHLHGLTHEPFLRKMIKDIIAYKVLYQTEAYDWEWIDQSFKKYFSACFGLPLSFDQSRIDAGFKAGSKAVQLIRWASAH